jgi:hypothetical protein
LPVFLADTPAAPPPAGPGYASQPDRGPVCGWYDSSHDLQQGLLVREHSTPDSLAAELPLLGWLEWQLAGWHAGRPG